MVIEFEGGAGLGIRILDRILTTCVRHPGTTTVHSGSFLRGEGKRPGFGSPELEVPPVDAEFGSLPSDREP